MLLMKICVCKFVVERKAKNQLLNKMRFFEISKYPVKDTDVIRGNEVTPEKVRTVKLVIDHALSGKCSSKDHGTCLCRPDIRQKAR